MTKLQGKVAVITGGNSGIGYATAQEFIQQGATVIITGRKEDLLQEAVQKLGSQAIGIVSDQADLKSTEALVARINEQYSKIDVLFINAGIAKFASVEETTEALFDETLNINFKGAYFTVQQFLPLLNEGSSIIFNATITASMGMQNGSAYSASKAALLSFAKVLASELAPRKIRVNSISPGPITTPIYSKMGMPEEVLDTLGQSLSNKTLLSRFGESAEIAKTALFLASEDSSYITGIEIVVDGGLLVSR